MGPVHLLQFSMHLQIVNQKSDWFFKNPYSSLQIAKKAPFYTFHIYLITSPHWRPGGGLASNIFISDIYYLCMLSESAWWEARVLYWLLSSFSGWKIDCLNQSPLVAGPSPSTKRGILFRTREKRGGPIQIDVCSLNVLFWWTSSLIELSIDDFCWTRSETRSFC